MTLKTIAAVCATMLLAACVEEEELQPPLPKPPSLEGAWTSCKTEDNMPQDEWETFLFTGNELQRVQLEYASNDGSCTGAVHGSVANVWDWNLTFGPDFVTTLGSQTVTARTFDSEVHHNMLYVDATPEPDVLYLGDPTAVPGLDGSTPDARPTVLWDSRPYRRQAASAIDASALAGNWATGCVENVAGDTIEVFTFLGHTLTVTRTTYESMDASCTGAATPSTFAAALALRGPVVATLGAGTVTARQVDLADDGFSGYTIMYVDTAATPQVLYVGELGATPETRPSVLGLGPPPHVRQ